MCPLLLLPVYRSPGPMRCNPAALLRRDEILCHHRPMSFNRILGQPNHFREAVRRFWRQLAAELERPSCQRNAHGFRHVAVKLLCRR